MSNVSPLLIAASTIGSGTVYELSEVRVCQFFAELLLRPAGKVTPAELLGLYVYKLIIIVTSGYLFSRDILKGGNNIGVRAGGRGVLAV